MRCRNPLLSRRRRQRRKSCQEPSRLTRARFNTVLAYPSVTFSKSLCCFASDGERLDSCKFLPLPTLPVSETKLYDLVPGRPFSANIHIYNLPAAIFSPRFETLSALSTYTCLEMSRHNHTFLRILHTIQYPGPRSRIVCTDFWPLLHVSFRWTSKMMPRVYFHPFFSYQVYLNPF